jgi:hypothetical protein
MSTTSDPVELRRKQLSRAQKLAKAITDYTNHTGLPGDVPTEELRSIYKKLTEEQGRLNDEIERLLD